jgi:hypothetical protein
MTDLVEEALQNIQNQRRVHIVVTNYTAPYFILLFQVLTNLQIMEIQCAWCDAGARHSYSFAVPPPVSVVQG